VKLLLDHHFAAAIAERLCADGHECVIAVEMDLHETDDERLLRWCATNDYTLVTNNISDFAVIVKRWAEHDQSHAGIIFHSDQTIGRAAQHTGWFVERLARLATKYPGENELTDRLLFTSDT